VLRIDMHTHIIPKYIPKFADKFGYGGFIHLEHHRKDFAKMMIGNNFFREIEANCWSPEKRFEDMDRNGIDVQVICTIPVMFSYWAKAKDTLQLAQFLNDDIAKIQQKHPKRFVALGTLPMQDPQLAIQELERCMTELNLAGVQIASHIKEWNLNAPELQPFFAACERLGAAIFIHPWEMMGKSEMERYWLPWLVGMPAETSRAICSMIFGGVFERFPKLRVAFSHGGGSFPGTIGRIEHGFNCRPDLVAIDNPINPKNYLGRFWVDSIVFDQEMLQRNVRLMGSNRVCLGSDYPFPLGELNTGNLIDSMQYDEVTKANLLHGAALEWLNMSKSKFV